MPLPYEPPSGSPAGTLPGAGEAFLSFDSVAHEYDWSRYMPPDVQREAARLIRDLAGLSPGQALLDAGVGTGRFALPLAELGVPVVGVDISDNMLARLQAKRAALEQERTSLPLWLVRGDLRRLPLASGVFSAALVVHILHLIADWQAVLREVWRVLAPGGVLVLAQESGRRVPTRDRYMDIAASRGLLRKNLGAHRAEVHAFLVETGARVEQMDASRVRWRHSWRVAEMLEMVRRRTWSSLWTIPDADHAAMMAETEAWARQTYGTLDAVEEADTMLMVWAVRRPT